MSLVSIRSTSRLSVGVVQESGRRLVARMNELSARSVDREFLPAHLEILETPVPPLARWLSWTICGSLAAALTWSCVATVDIYAEARARIQPGGRSKPVQAASSGRVKAILVANGSTVHKGQPLVDLTSEEADAEFKARRSALAAVEARIEHHRVALASIGRQTPEEAHFAGIDAEVERQERVSLQADLDKVAADRASIMGQLAENDATAKRLTDGIAARKRLQAILQERADMKIELERRHSGSRASVLDATQQVEQAATDLAHDVGQMAETQAARESLMRKLEQAEAGARDGQAGALAEAVGQREAAKEQVIQAAIKQGKTHAVTPIDGTVQQVSVNAPGQVVTEGQPLAIVVPDDGSIEVEALVPDQDIGFVETGQQAVLKVDAFPFTRYGTLTGTVVQVSRDATTDSNARTGSDPMGMARGVPLSPQTDTASARDLVYAVKVRLDRQSIRTEKGDVALMPGMTGTVEMRTGRRRMIDYVLAPITETAARSGHER